MIRKTVYQVRWTLVWIGPYLIVSIYHPASNEWVLLAPPIGWFLLVFLPAILSNALGVKVTMKSERSEGDWPRMM